MMCFVYDYNFCLLCDLIHQVLIFVKQQIGMVDDLERIEAFQYLRNKSFYSYFPYGYPCRCRNDQYDIFTLLLYETLYQHHADISFSQTNAVAQERSRMMLGYLNQAVIAVLLILRQPFIYDRFVFFPFGYRFLMALEILIHRAQINIIGTELTAVHLHDL